MLNKLKAFVKTKRSDYVRKKLIDPRYGFLFDEPPTDEWVSLDLEMTGLNPKNDDILSVGAVLIKRVADDQGGGRYIIDTKSCLSLVCRPRVMPTTDSIVIHGLRPMDVMDGISHDDMVAQLLPMIGARPLVGFCIDLDV